MATTVTVLVIDDDLDIRDMLTMLLHDEGGYTVIAAADLASALDILHATPHRLVVLFDHHMPRMEGEALLALAAHESHLIECHAFVCMTGDSRTFLPPTLKALLARYAVPLVAKPFDIDDMLAVIQQAAQRLAQRPVRTRPTPQLKRWLRRAMWDVEHR